MGCMEHINEQMQTKVHGSYDVIVVGGGVAGVGAALAAARQGVSTLLIEKAAYFGGLATLGHVCIYLPLCDGNGRKVVGGIAEELLHTSIRYSYNDLPAGWEMGVSHVENPAGRYRTWFNVPAFVLALDELILQNGVKVLFDTVFCEPIMEKDRCNGVIVENKTGRCAYKAKMVVDATGDADVMYRAGAECFDGTTILSYWFYETEFSRMKKAIENNNMLEAVHVPMLGLLPKKGPGDFVRGKGEQEDGDYREYHGTNADEVTAFLLDSRKLALNRLRENQRPDYAMLSVSAMGDFRTTRRIVGRYELGPDDVFKSFDDSIGCTGDWRGSGPVYEIPYRSLLDGKVENIFAAGRIIGSRGDAWEVTRVIPPAVMTGEAAGTAAALAIKSGVTADKVDVAHLQAVLAKNGVVIHQ